MTHTSTEQERVEFDAWWTEWDNKGIASDGAKAFAFSAWQAARRALVVPHGWKLAPEESTEAMARAFRADDAPYYFAMTTIRCNDFAERYRAALAAAPQPPEAAPVQLPEPVAKVEDGGLKWHIPDSGYSLPVRYLQGTHKLYTEQQVRQLLAAQGQRK